jgi:hypothetical protein
MEVILTHCAGLDILKKTVMACGRDTMVWWCGAAEATSRRTDDCSKEGGDGALQAKPLSTSAEDLLSDVKGVRFQPASLTGCFVYAIDNRSTE